MTHIEFNIKGIDCYISVLEYVIGSGDAREESDLDYYGYMVYELLTKRGKYNKRLNRMIDDKYHGYITSTIEKYYD